MHIEASKKKVAKSDKEVFEFLTDIKNFETLMPDNIGRKHIQICIKRYARNCA